MKNIFIYFADCKSNSTNILTQKLNLDCFSKSGFEKLFYAFALFIVTSTTIAQTTTTFPNPDRCTSKDLELVSATLTGGDACNSCLPDAVITRTLTLGINNKTGSERTAFAFWGTLEITHSDGSITTTPISRCSDSTPIPSTGPLPAVYTGGNFGTITYVCGDSLRLINLYLAWTDAGPKSTCPTLDSSKINPKCGTLPSIQINVGVNGSFALTHVTCFGVNTGAIVLTPSGGTGPYTYDWSDVAGTNNPKDRANLAAGVYTVIITDSNNCSITKSATITGPSADLTLGECSKTDVTCSGGNGSLIAGLVSNNIGTVNYSWKNASNVVVGTLGSLSNLIAGTYTLTVTDNCTSKTCTVTIAAPPTISTPAATVTQPDCITALGTVSITSPVVGITYTLKQGGVVKYTAVSGVFNSVAAGTYALVASVGICSATGNNVVVNAQPLTPATPTICVVQPSLCGPTTGSVTILSPTGAGYEFSIDNGTTWQASPDFINLLPGSVTGVKVKKGDCISAGVSCDASNCEAAKIIANQSSSVESFEKMSTAEAQKTNFDVYPVPFKDKLHIKYNFDYATDITVELFDIRGALILSKKVTNSYSDANSHSDKELVLNLNSNIRNEQMYFVRVNTNKGSSVRKVVTTR